MNISIFLAIQLVATGGAQTPYQWATPTLDQRVEAILRQITLQEKLGLVHGNSKFATAGVPRLGVPSLWMSDGPHGVREEISRDSWQSAGHTDDFSSFMPANICLAATWNPEIARATAGAIGQEAKLRGKNIMLAPGVNIMRTPLNGRNFEYFGEDPFLASRMAVGYVEGEQAQGVSSCVKHYAGNNQETERGSIDVEMDDRTLYEIYLPAFKAAVQEGGAMSVMAAYNRFRGQYCSENELLINKILKGEWGFKGLVMSDWGGVHSTKEAALSGLDLEMGSSGPYENWYFANPLADAVKSGSVPMEVIDDKARRNLRVILETGPNSGPRGSINTLEHQTAARKAAEEGIVLLKNDGILPLDPSKIRTIAVIGENALAKVARGGGSAGIKAFYEVTPLDGLLRRVGSQVNVTYSQGYRSPPRRGSRPNRAGVSASGLASEIDQAALADRAVEAAKSANLVVYVGGLYHGRNGDDEGSDRGDMKLPFGQDKLLSKLLQANPHTVVVMMGGGPVEMDEWLARAPALLESWYPGMEGGNAIAETLFGDVNPSGKLPCTFPRRLQDSPAHALNAYPGEHGVEKYPEGLLVGYRWFDTKNVEPLFPFGFGLSYTTFGYSSPRLTGNLDNSPGISVGLDVENTGKRKGAEVVEVYVQPVTPPVSRPVKELKGFTKVELNPGEKKPVEIRLDAHSFAYFDADRHSWVVAPGEYKILVGASSRDIRAQVTYRVEKEMVIP